MNPEPETSTQQQIIKILRIRGPKKQSDLAHILGKAPSTIKYHLDALSERAIIVADQTKHYRVAGEGDIEKAILEAFVSHGKQKKEELLNLEELAAFGDHLNETYQNLITKGLVIEKSDGITELTRWGTSKLGICYVCYKPVTGLSTVSFVTDSMLFEQGREPDWGDVTSQITAVLIHPKCFRKIANDMIGDFGIQIPDDCFCDYCGLPLSVGVYKMLVSSINVHASELENSLTKEERIVLNQYPGMRGWSLNCPESVEEFVSRIDKELAKSEVNYHYVNLPMRERHIWYEARSIIERKQARLDRFVHLLYRPIEIAYSAISGPDEFPWIWNTIKTEKENSKVYEPNEASFSMVFVGEKGQRFHPRCAQILQSKESKRNGDGEK